MTSNGILLDLLADELKQAGLDRLNISLDTLDAGKYRQITRNGDIDRVLAGIAAARAAGFAAIKINMVLIPGCNDRRSGGHEGILPGKRPAPAAHPPLLPARPENGAQRAGSRKAALLPASATACA